MGETLRKVLTGGTIQFSNESLSNLKDFVAQKEINYRAKLMDLIMQHVSKNEQLNFNHVLVQ